MRKVYLVLCACALWAASLHCAGAQDPNAALKAVAKSNRNFTTALYTVLSRTEGNLFFSPLSIHTILTLASVGARGSTEEEMTRGLYLPTGQQVTKEGFQQLTNTLKRNDSIIVKIANMVVTDQDIEPTQRFIQAAHTYFNTAVSRVDFKRDSQGVRQKINSWVEDNTGQKIKNMIQEGSLGSGTQMLLINAVYFKADWDVPFKESYTTNKPFYVSETVTKQVSMMYAKRECFYKKWDALDAQILELQYVDRKMGLVIILPNKRHGLKAVERRLASIDLNSLTDDMDFPEVEVWLPKFKMEEALNMNDVLAEMGMPSIFLDSADFSGIANQSLSISKVSHKAYLEVNEKGTEAAAATDVGLVSKVHVIHVRREQFRADHPFIILLRPKIKGNPVLFMGRYSSP